MPSRVKTTFTATGAGLGFPHPAIAPSLYDPASLTPCTSCTKQRRVALSGLPTRNNERGPPRTLDARKYERLHPAGDNAECSRPVRSCSRPQLPSTRFARAPSTACCKYRGQYLNYNSSICKFPRSNWDSGCCCSKSSTSN